MASTAVASRRVIVVGVVGVVVAVGAHPGLASRRLAEQDTISISAPASVPANTRLTVSVSYTLTDSQPTLLSVGLQPATTGACPASEFDAISSPNHFEWISGSFHFPDVSVQASGTTRIEYTQAVGGDFSPATGLFLLCAWLGNGDPESSALAAAQAPITFTSPPPPPPPPPGPAVYLGGTSYARSAFEIENGVVVNFTLPPTKLPCSGTTPSTTYLTWFFPFSGSSLIHWKLAPSGSFAGSWTQYHGATFSVRGRLVGTRITGTYTEVLHPISAMRIRQDAPPHTLITGGVCRGGGRFTTVRAHS
jgi:hypothetical protein